MALDPRTPICVGAAPATQRFDDPSLGHDAIGLMSQAVRAAAADAGSSRLLAEAQLVAVAGGSWNYVNAPQLVAEAVGAHGARTHMIVPGVLQTGMFNRALSAIARGELDIAIVCGGEAKWRELRGRITGTPVAVTAEADDASGPDEVVNRTGEVISRLEIARKMYDAASHYAMIENARRGADGQTLEEHRRTVAEFWARFNVVAQSNPGAWNRRPMGADEIATTTAKNRLLAFPYNKWHVSQQNVDQASAMVFCSVERAEALGIARDRWVFPHVIVDSNHVVPVSARAMLHRAPGFAVAGARAFALAGIGVDDIDHVDVYSCFPIAARTQALELGLGLGDTRPLTVTGGMVFGGGPFGNYVVQSTSKMMEVLRADPASRGLVTAISGMISKQGVSVWSTEPPSGGYRYDDVSEAAKAAIPAKPVIDAAEGPGTVATYTVTTNEAGPHRIIAVVDIADGARALVTREDPALAAEVVGAEWLGASVRVHADGSFSLP